MTNEEAAVIRRLQQQVQAIGAAHKTMAQRYGELEREIRSQPRSIVQEIDAIPGRRLFYNLNGRQSFTAANAGRRNDPITFLVSQDGPFIMTHYPMATWKPNAPANATNFGAWRPVATWPLPDQVLDTDLIDLSWDFQDSGSQRNFQNERTSSLWSRPDSMVPLPVPTLFAPNTTIALALTYERIAFDTAAAVPTEGGELVIVLPGYRIVNL
jgi:hypothetical protein